MDKTTERPEPASSAAAPVADLTGSRLGDFHLLRRLGQGGMGQVYLAEQISLKRKVAIKLLRTDLAASEGALQRFKREAEAVARATHANIVQVYAIGEQDGQHYMALEYVEGRNLRDYLEKKGPPEVLISVGILRQVASALQRAGELGVIHRDVKPDNILITRKGEVKVADFGLSRIYGDEQQPLNLTQSGVTMGTPLYMSPEQVEGKPLDPRTDIYSLGVTAYHLLAGQPPFRGQSPFDVALQHVQKEPPPLSSVRPDLPPELCLMVHRMMAKRPEDRYQTAQDIVRDLSGLRDHLVGLSNTQLSAAVASGLSQTYVPRWQDSDASSTQVLPRVGVRGGFPWLAAVGILLMLGTGTALGLWWSNSHAPKPKDEPVVQAVEDHDPDRQEEQMLLKDFAKIKESATPDDVRDGLHDCIKLAWLYLNRDLRKDPTEFKETAQFFAQLKEMKKPMGYHYFGQIGEAMVWAFQDRAKDSTERLDELLPRESYWQKPKGKPGDKFLSPEKLKVRWFWDYLGKNKQFSKMLSLALERNRSNLGQKALAPHLEFFRTRQNGTKFPDKSAG